MNEKTCNHNKRFKGVMFTSCGCLACELEKMISEWERLEERAIDRDMKIKILLQDIRNEQNLTEEWYKKARETEARIKELEEAIGKHRETDTGWSYTEAIQQMEIRDIELYKLIEKEKP